MGDLLRIIIKGEEVDLVMQAEMPDLVKRPDFFAFVGGIWNPMGKEENSQVVRRLRFYADIR